MVQVVGDGGYYFCNPASVFAVAQQYGLPLLLHRPSTIPAGRR